MAKNFRCYIEMDYDDTYKEKLFSMLGKWNDLDEKDTNEIKDYLWKYFEDRFKIVGIQRETMKMSVDLTRGWISEKNDVIYELTFLKKNGKTCVLNVYEKMMVNAFDLQLMEPNGWFEGDFVEF